MSSNWGNQLKLSIFGESHGNGIGVVLDGLPAGIPIDQEEILAQMARRAPGRDKSSTPRKEADTPRFATLELPSTNMSAPFTKNTKPTMRQSSTTINGALLMKFSMLIPPFFIFVFYIISFLIVSEM